MAWIGDAARIDFWARKHRLCKPLHGSKSMSKIVSRASTPSQQWCDVRTEVCSTKVKARRRACAKTALQAQCMTGTRADSSLGTRSTHWRNVQVCTVQRRCTKRGMCAVQLVSEQIHCALC